MTPVPWVYVKVAEPIGWLGPSDEPPPLVLLVSWNGIAIPRDSEGIKVGTDLSFGPNSMLVSALQNLP